MKDEAQMVALIKPQFEAGREQVGKKGVVREPKVHKEVIRNVLGYATEAGFTIRGIDHSPIRGPEGNIEYLLWLTATIVAAEEEGTGNVTAAEEMVAEATGTDKKVQEWNERIDALVQTAHETL
jgi:23S rRNA (cytidine1920-2'-O)/16S rRNA (cytidine1409-2'-O)-methyltransferase